MQPTKMERARRAGQIIRELEDVDEDVRQCMMRLMNRRVRKQNCEREQQGLDTAEQRRADLLHEFSTLIPPAI